MSTIVKVAEWYVFDLNQQISDWRSRAENAEKRWNYLVAKFPGVAETIKDHFDELDRIATAAKTRHKQIGQEWH